MRRSRNTLWTTNICSFALTDRHFVLVEQPLVLSLPRLVSGQLGGRPLADALKWRGETDETVFRLVDRITGEEVGLEYRSEGFFFLHTINAYEESGHVVLDISCYDVPNMLHLMDIKQLQVKGNSSGCSSIIDSYKSIHTA